MNLDFIRDNFRFNARTFALIYNKEENKINFNWIICIYGNAL